MLKNVFVIMALSGCQTAWADRNWSYLSITDIYGQMVLCYDMQTSRNLPAAPSVPVIPGPLSRKNSIGTFRRRHARVSYVTVRTGVIYAGTARR